MRRQPALPAIALTTGLFGTILGCLFTAYLPSKTLGIIAAAVVIVAFCFGRFLVCGIGLGLIAVSLNAPIPYADSLQNCQFNAQIIRPNFTQRHLGKAIRLYADHIVCDNANLPAQTLQYWDNSQNFADYTGKRLVVSANLTPVHSRLNPYSFDYERHLLSEGIRLSADKLRIIATHEESSPLLKARQHVADSVFNSLSRNNAGIILALLTGNRTALSPEQKMTLQRTGTSHLLAISGLHLALIGGMAWLIFQASWALSWRLSDLLSPRHAGAIAALIIITAYAVFTGFDIPVKRAWIMFSLLILSWLAGRGLSKSSLLLAASVVMLIEPYAVVSVGFYFSFIATFVVLWSVRLPYSPLANVLIMQGLINLMLFPITWFAFGSVSPVAFFVNLLVIPWLGLWVLPWAVLASLVSLLSQTLSAPIWQLVETSTTMLWQTISVADQLHWTITPQAPPSLLAVILALSTVILALISGKKWLFCGIACVFIPLVLPEKPALLVADRGYTSALIHNGREAIIINSGYRYRHRNHAEMWLRYLRQHRLALAAVVLENDKLTRISATKWLLDNFPEAKVITAEKIDLPYASHFCQPVRLEQLTLTAVRQGNQGNHCQLTITWFNHPLELFIEGDNTINKGQLTWQGKTYDASALGAVTITHQQGEFDRHYLRQNLRLWRNH